MRTSAWLLGLLLMAPAFGLAAPGATLPAAAPPGVPALAATTAPAPDPSADVVGDLDVPFVVDERGDTIEGDLAITGTLVVNGAATLTSGLRLPGGGVAFDGGALSAAPDLAFQGRRVCLEGGAVAGCREVPDGAVTTVKLADGAVTGVKVLDGSLGLGDLGFVPALAADLAAHRAGGDHDGRYATRGELASGGAINDAANPVAWTRLLGVPAGFADGLDADSGGDVTSVGAGHGLTGGGEAGALSLAADLAVVQARVAGVCAPGFSIRAIAGDGAVTCQEDHDSGGDVTSVGAGFGLLGGGLAGALTLEVDTGAIQRRVAAGCAAGSAIRSIALDGGVVCEVDDDTTYAAGAGLALSATTFSVPTGAITGAMVADGSVAAADVAFAYAGSSSKGGPASDLGCTGCVGTSDLAAGAVTPAKVAAGTYDISITGSAPPSGPAGGDLSGSYPNPTVKQGLESAFTRPAQDWTITGTLRYTWAWGGGGNGQVRSNGIWVSHPAHGAGGGMAGYFASMEDTYIGAGVDWANGDRVEVVEVVRIEALPAFSDTTHLHGIGLADTGGLVYDTPSSTNQNHRRVFVGVDRNGAWKAVTSDGVVATVTDLGVAYTAGTLVKVRIDFTKGSSVVVTIDDHASDTITATLPSRIIGHYASAAQSTAQDTLKSYGGYYRLTVA